MAEDVGLYDRDRWRCTQCTAVSDGAVHVIGGRAYCGGRCRVSVNGGWRFPHFVRDGRFPPDPRRLFRERHPVLGAIRDWWDDLNSGGPVNGA